MVVEDQDREGTSDVFYETDGKHPYLVLSPQQKYRQDETIQGYLFRRKGCFENAGKRGAGQQLSNSDLAFRIWYKSL